MRTFLAALALVFLVLTPVHAQSTQGVAQVGSTLTGIRPVAIGGADASNLSRYLRVDPAGNLFVSIAAVNTTSGTPSGQVLLLDANRALIVQNGINPFTDNVVAVGVFVSNGVTPVDFAGALNGVRNFVCTFTAENTSTTTSHTLYLLDQVTNRILYRASLAPGTSTTPGGQLLIDMNQGAIQSSTGSALQIYLGDAGGADVVCTANIVSK